MPRQVLGAARPPCRFFQEGRCANPACTFRHVAAHASAAGGGAWLAPGAQAGSRRVVARAAQPAGGARQPVEGSPPPQPPPAAAPKPAPKPALAMGVGPIVALAGIDVASAAMAHIAGRQVLQPRASLRGSAARSNSHAVESAAPAAPCRFFCRTGACERGEGCKFEHDAGRVALCRAFLAGKCGASEGAARGRAPGPGVCLLSHDATPERTPACSFFLRGLCVDPRCVYVHIAVSRSAPPCADFANGYCAKGLGCTDQHLLACEDWASAGSCPRGDECPLRRTHRASTVGAKRARQASEGAPAAEEEDPLAGPVPRLHVAGDVAQARSTSEVEHVFPPAIDAHADYGE